MLDIGEGVFIAQYFVSAKLAAGRTSVKLAITEWSRRLNLVHVLCIYAKPNDRALASKRNAAVVSAEGEPNFIRGQLGESAFRG